jgi:hypothetical protein
MLDTLAAKARAEKEKPEGDWPKDLGELMGTPQLDAWENELRYVVEGDDLDLRSAGPDGHFDSSDDVTLELAAQIKTRASLREVGDALGRWREATEAWPESMDAMRESPGEGLLPPLRSAALDGWERPLVYVLKVDDATEDAPPELYSAGADGEPGTDDDVLAVVHEDGVQVPTGIAFIPFLAAEQNDAWDRPLRIDFTHALTWQWEVKSAGADGAWDTDDDLDKGNAAEIEAFYARPEVKAEFEVPMKKEFELLFVHLPLVPDEVLKKLLEAYPHHKVEEEAAFDHWRGLRGFATYMAKDPKDPESGHGAEFLQAFELDREVSLLPAPDVFGEAPEGFVGPNDPDRKEYVEQGWRPIVLREMFLERLMNDLLTRARDSRDAAVAWDEKNAALEESESEETEDLGERPHEITFEELLDGELAAFQPEDDKDAWIALYETTEPMSRTELEGIPHLGGMELTQELLRLREDGKYAAVPTILNDSHTKAIVRLLKDHPRHDRELDEVRAEVFERYLVGVRLDLATRRLEALRDAVSEALEPAEAEEPAEEEEPTEGEGEGADEDAPVVEKDPDEVWRETLATWAAESEVPYVRESTGPFIGARPPRAHDLEGKEDDAATPRLKRLDFVRTTGYENLRAGVPAGTELEVGAIARSVLRDEDTEGTDSVYLIRLTAISYPPKAAFSPRDYADYLSAEAFGGSRGGRRIGAVAGSEQAPGTFWEGLRNFYFWPNFEWLKDKFDLRTEVDLTSPPDPR